MDTSEECNKDSGKSQLQNMSVPAPEAEKEGDEVEIILSKHEDTTDIKENKSAISALFNDNNGDNTCTSNAWDSDNMNSRGKSKCETPVLMSVTCKSYENQESVEVKEVLTQFADEIINGNTDAVKDSTVKISNNLKRKRRNVSIAGGESLSAENGLRSKRKKSKNANDRFCWRCHKESVEAHCSACPRSWHRKCMGGTQPLSAQNWICGECATILRAENAETRSMAMAHLSVDQLCMLLKHVVERMRDYPGSEPFWKPVEISDAPNYLDYVVKPMDLSLLESNVRSKLYGSTDAFMADAKWIQHNCIVFNTCGGVYADTSKLTNAAKQMIKLARQEVSEIEACPDCYGNSRNLPRPQPSWFIEPCRRPHTLVWAKLKGFPFWPAKAMPRVNSQGFVDVRFFGQHDRAWVSPKDLYLYSEDPPNPLPRKKRPDMDECVQEITRHCRKLEIAFGDFKYAPPKIQYNPNDPMQIKLMLPHYDPLQLTNSLISQHSVPKKKPVLRKGTLSVKTVKTENDESRGVIDVDISDSERSVCFEEKTSAHTSKEQQTENANKLNNSLNSSSNNKSSMVEDKEEEEQKSSNHHEDVDSMEEKANTNASNLKEVPVNDSVANTIKCENDTLKEKYTSNENSLKQKSHTAENMLDVVAIQKKPALKNITSKSTIAHNTTNVQKVTSKSTKNVAKVYKPKTRMVDKMNAEKKLLKAVSENKQNENSQISLLEDEEVALKTKQQINIAEPTKTSVKSNVVSIPSSASNNKTQSNSNSIASSVVSTGTDQSLGLLYVVDDAIKHSTPLSNTHSVIKREAKEQFHQVSPQRKESKARKSFPNKPLHYSQRVSLSTKSLDTIESVDFMATMSNENSTYQLVPPEAGPLSARLSQGAQELAKKMAQLMEEAYREAAKESQKEDDKAENHQATIHFLRLQIERMQWQHQQQLAELKHNTDRVLREMRASLEAERLRAVEETRRESEADKLRCIEETKCKQWCAMCGCEALFYCCWNTAYCDYQCQQSHWPTHMRTCAQQPSFATIVTGSTASSHQQQQQQQQNINTMRSPAGRDSQIPHSKQRGIVSSANDSYLRNESGHDSS